jgi:hypothetical protein
LEEEKTFCFSLQNITFSGEVTSFPQQKKQPRKTGENEKKIQSMLAMPIDLNYELSLSRQ